MLKRLFPVFGAIFFVLIVSSCTDVSVPVPELEARVPEHYHNAAQETQPDAAQISSAAAELSASPQLYSWWEIFSDKTLNALLDDVLMRNLDISAALANLDILLAAEKQASSSLWPQLSGEATVSRYRRNIRSFNLDAEGTIDAVTSTNYRVSTPVFYEIDLWGRLRNSATAAERERLASEQDLFSVTMSIAAQTVESYYQIRELCSQISLLERTISAEEKMYSIVKKRYRDGIAKPLDVHQARQTLTTRRSQRPRLKLGLAQAQHTLSVLLGEYPKSRFSCAEMAGLPEFLPRVPPGLPADLLMRRPDLRAAMFRLEAADQRVAASIKSLLPAFVISASVGYEDLELSNLFRIETLVWNALGNISQNLFNGGRNLAKIDAAHAEKSLLKAEYYKAALTAFKEVEDTLAAEEELRGSLQLLETRIASIKRTLRLSTSQYLQGLEDYFQVAAAQGTYYLAQSELLALRREILSNHVQLSRALGGGWEEDKIVERYENHEDVM